MIYKVFKQQARYIGFILNKLLIISMIPLLSILIKSLSLYEENLNFVVSYHQIFNFFQIGFLYFPITIVTSMVSIRSNLSEYLRVRSRKIIVLQGFFQITMVQTLLWFIWSLGVSFIFFLTKSVNQSEILIVLLLGLLEVYLVQIMLASIGILGWILSGYKEVVGMIGALTIELITMGMALNKQSIILWRFIFPDYPMTKVVECLYLVMLIGIVYVICRLVISRVDI